MGVLLIAAGASAQRTYEPHFDIGAKGGVTLSKMAFSPGIEQFMKMGFTGGLMVRYTEEKLFGLIGELKIEQRGWKETFDETDFSYNRTLTYIQMPLLTHIYFGNQRIKGFVNLGPSVGYMISNSASANFDYHNPGSVEGFPIENRHVNQMSMEVKNKFDYGIALGLGGEYLVKPRHSVTLEARFYFGLGNVFPSTKRDSFSASRCMSLEISTGYFFRLK